MAEAAKLVIVNYGLANLRSVQKAFEHVGFSAEITSDPQRVHEARQVVLPGVGAFRDAIAALRQTGLGEAVLQHVRRGKPMLGICLGLQLLFTRSREDGDYAGLNLYPGEVVRFPSLPGLKVPHMGWNTLRLTQPQCRLFAGLPVDPAVYFVHGYFPQPEDAKLIAATADYPTPFCAAICQDNVVATQFHPEKSQQIGLAMLQNFANWT
jgi:glutamine amidotransferase